MLKNAALLLGAAAIGVAGTILVTSLFGDEAEAAEVSTAAGIVFRDTNGNGQRDDGEPGIPGVTVIASAPVGAVGTVTSPDGTYSFEMNTSSFSISADTSTLPDGWWDLTTSRESYTLNVPPDFFAPNINFGYREVQPASAQGIVFEDGDGDGVYDDGEPGLPGVTILVTTDDDAATVTTVTTDGDGRWIYESGTIDHRVTVDPGSLPWPAELTTGRESYNLNVPPDFFAPNINFGYQEVPPANAYGVVFEDANGNGERDDGEPGIPDVILVAIHDETGAPITTTTDANGEWSLQATPIDHRVTVDPGSLPWPAELTTGRESYNLNVPPDFFAPNIDFGYREVEPAAAAGTVFEDTDGNGQQDDGEPGLPGVVLWIADRDTGDLTTVTTDGDGRWRFEAPVFVYRISVDPASLPWPAESTTGRESYTLNVPPGFIAPNLDFGYREVPPAGAQGRVFEDLNGDGEQADGEPGLPGVTVVLTSANSVVEVVTGEDGAWEHRAGSIDAIVHVDRTTLPDRLTGIPALTTGSGTYAVAVSDDTEDGLDFGYRWVDFAGAGPGSPPTTTTVPPTTTTPSTTTTTMPTTTAGPVTGTACLPGEWLLDSPAFVDSIQSAVGAQGVPGDLDYESGGYTMVIGEDWSYTATRDRWTLRASTSEGSLYVVLDGVQQGAVNAEDGGGIEVREESDSVTVSLEIEAGGVRQPLPGGQQSFEGDAFAGSGTFECSGDRLIVTTSDGFVSEWSRIG